MITSPEGIQISLDEAIGLVGCATILKSLGDAPDHDEAAIEQLRRQIDLWLEVPEFEDTPIILTPEETTTLYAFARQISVMGLNIVVDALRQQERTMVEAIGGTWQEANERPIREDAEDYQVTADHFLRVVGGDSD